ncbi:MAG: AraC family transcriptional regulator [Bacteroidales bacterium]|nr:AraC family transcriptional regulator [Bacteroidales bacterium]
MLKDSSMPVSDVAYTLGFESPTHFSRLFKQRFQCSPSAV